MGLFHFIFFEFLLLHFIACLLFVLLHEVPYMRGLGGEGIWCDFDGVVVSMLASIVAGSLHESEAGRCLSSSV